MFADSDKGIVPQITTYICLDDFTADAISIDEVFIQPRHGHFCLELKCIDNNKRANGRKDPGNKRRSWGRQILSIQAEITVLGYCLFFVSGR